MLRSLGDLWIVHTLEQNGTIMLVQLLPWTQDRNRTG